MHINSLSSALISILLMLSSTNTFSETGKHNITTSPDGKWICYTKGGDLYVQNGDSPELRLTSDGSSCVYNGYASWVYYEEIFGRPTCYKAFWWSPDSKKIAFYRFDDSLVCPFHIYSPFEYSVSTSAPQRKEGPVTFCPGSLSSVRYPLAGATNPEVRLAVADISDPEQAKVRFYDIEEPFEYLGTPFWSDDSAFLYLQTMPRRQNALSVLKLELSSGKSEAIYREKVEHFLTWISGMLFTSKGLYMARCLDEKWQQLYFLSYDGKLKTLTNGNFWDIYLVAETSGKVFFTANLDGSLTRSLFACNASSHKVVRLTDPCYSAYKVELSSDGKAFKATMSNLNTPEFTVEGSTSSMCEVPASALKASQEHLASGRPLDVLTIKTTDGFALPAIVCWPDSLRGLFGGGEFENLFQKGDFQSIMATVGDRRFPVHFKIYGGPDTPLVYDRFRKDLQQSCPFFASNGIIDVVVDPRSAGHSGMAGEALSFGKVSYKEMDDYRAWGEYFASLPFVRADRMGVEGFSFGGTNTFMLLCHCGDIFRCGIAGGGVYDWRLYDSHYTERYMDTPQDNPEGYHLTSCIENAGLFDDSRNVLMLTHGTSDDNVHFQNLMLLVDALEKAGKKFSLCIYPGELHGYHGPYASHREVMAKDFWLENLCDSSK